MAPTSADTPPSATVGMAARGGGAASMDADAGLKDQRRSGSIDPATLEAAMQQVAHLEAQSAAAAAAKAAAAKKAAKASAWVPAWLSDMMTKDTSNQQRQARAPLVKPATLYCGPKYTSPMPLALYSDADWLVSLNRPCGTLAADLREFCGGALPMPAALKKLPLEFADKEFEFVAVPQITGFCGYWSKDPQRSTPAPLPTDIVIDANKLVRATHESIPGILLQETATTLSMTAKPQAIPLGPLSRYVETFAKDGATTSWKIRRDVVVTGRSYGQMFFTSCGTLIFRTIGVTMWSDEPELITEDYMRLEDGGNIILVRQCAKHVPSGRRGLQYIVGEYWGPTPPPGH